MKVYNLNIDTSQPTNQVVQMQQNQTSMLSVAISNEGKYIRNLSCKMYYEGNEIPTTISGDNTFGFKIDVGVEPKYVKIEAKSEPIVCTADYIADIGSSGGAKTYQLRVCQLSEGVYSQDEFKAVGKEIAKYIDNGRRIVCTVSVATQSNININGIVILFNGDCQFYRGTTSNTIYLDPDEPIIVTGNAEIVHFGYGKRNAVIANYEYPAIGYYTDYQLDTLIRPSVNAPYDGDYTEPLTEIEVDGVKFVPTTLTIDGVEYKVLAEEQPKPEEPVEPETPTEPTNDGE